MAKAVLAQEVKERPIIFGAESVCAILEGRKTQTRRVVKNPDKYEHIRECGFCCPYGQPSERLWVREAFAVESSYNVDDVRRYQPPHKDGRPTRYAEDGETAWWEQCHYRATDPQPELCCEHESCDGSEPCSRVWKMPLFMPRWASRITLELTEVRVERVQEITREDALAEGVHEMFKGENFPLREQRMALEQHAYAEAWDALNAKRGFGWDKNPWVWVLPFRRVQDTRA